MIIPTKIERLNIKNIFVPALTMSVKHTVKIRFNTNYRENDPKGKEWRVIVDGKEHFCNHVSILCPSYTSKDMIEGVGAKWHVSCEASKIEFIKDAEGEFRADHFREIIIS